MVPSRELTGIIPAYLVRSCPKFLIQCTDQRAIYINVKLTECNAAFVDQAERLPGEWDRDCGTVLSRFHVGTAVGL